MPIAEVVERSVDVPEGVKVEIQGRHVKVTGPEGTLEEDLSHAPVAITMQESKVVVRAVWPRKKESSMVGTATARIRNLIRGVTGGFTYKLKIVYAHFPVTVKVNEKERKLFIDNFTGEKTPRIARLVGNVKVTTAGDEIVVRGARLEEVSQTAANIQAATRIKDKDQRVFLDGIYVSEKKGGS
jgi:large subunit ribosomal protein L6